MHALARMRTWTSIGLLLLAAGLPYCAAAASWGVTSDDTAFIVRADIAFGVVLAFMGLTVLTAVGLLWLWHRIRRGDPIRPASSPARAPTPPRA